MTTSYSWEGKGMYGSFRLRTERVSVQVKLRHPLRGHAIPERFMRWWFTKRRYIKYVRYFTVTAALRLNRKINGCFTVWLTKIRLGGERRRLGV